jgi:hypothetical protein
MAPPRCYASLCGFGFTFFAGFGTGFTVGAPENLSLPGSLIASAHCAFSLDNQLLAAT